MKTKRNKPILSNSRFSLFLSSDYKSPKLTPAHRCPAVDTTARLFHRCCCRFADISLPQQHQVFVYHPDPWVLRHCKAAFIEQKLKHTFLIIFILEALKVKISG